MEPVPPSETKLLAAMLAWKLRLLTLEREISPRPDVLPCVPPPIVLMTVTGPPVPLAVLNVRLLYSPVVLNSVEFK